MACYLQALTRNMMVTDGNLADPPFWLSEGLTQLMMKSRHEEYGKIARYYQKLRGLPALEQVQNWEGFSDGFLESRWRQTFAYWLVKFATREMASRQALTLWLQSGNYAQDHSFLAANSRNENWWTDSVSDAPNFARHYDWDETLTLFEQHKQIKVTLKPTKSGEEGRQERLFIGDLPEPRRLATIVPVREKIDALAEFQLRAHPAWMKIIEYYRLTLELWLTGDQEEFKKCIEASGEQERKVSAYMTLVADYMDWVTVNVVVDLNSGKVPSHAKIARGLIRETADSEGK
jgi:hypothetical protein